MHRTIVALLAVLAACGGGTTTPRDDRDCPDFSTREEAQAFFRDAGGPDEDPHRLDQDGNGVACEELPSSAATQMPVPTSECEPAYPDVCIAPPPPDLSCADVPHRRFAIRSPDPHGFDQDSDGIGCE